MTNQQNDAAVLSSSHTDVALNETKPDAPETEEEQENEEYLTGFKLAAIVGSLTLVVFLLMLDQAILGTVGLAHTDPNIAVGKLTWIAAGHSSNR